MSKSKKGYASIEESRRRGKEIKAKGLLNEAVAGEIMQEPRRDVKVEGGDLKRNIFSVNPEERSVGKRTDYEGVR